MDAEVVAIDPATGALKTFQELSNRARKDVKLDEVKVAVCVFAFDIMFLDGQVNHRRCPVYVIVRLIQYLWAQQILLEKPFRERRALLRTRFPPYTPPKKGAPRFDHGKSVESDQASERCNCTDASMEVMETGEKRYITGLPPRSFNCRYIVSPFLIP